MCLELTHLIFSGVTSWLDEEYFSKAEGNIIASLEQDISREEEEEEPVKEEEYEGLSKEMNYKEENVIRDSFSPQDTERLAGDAAIKKKHFMKVPSRLTSFHLKLNFQYLQNSFPDFLPGPATHLYLNGIIPGTYSLWQFDDKNWYS